MKHDTQLASLLTQIEGLVTKCIKLVGKSGGNRKPKPTQKPAKDGLPERILALRDKGFFSQPKTGNDVHEKLKSTYPSDDDRVFMALLRLMRRKKLRKSSKVVNGKKQVAYVW